MCQSVLRHMYHAPYDNKQVIGVFVDLAKAFGSINGWFLLKKLEHYGIREEALKWFESYFLHMKQCVTYNNVKSDLLSVNFGVPQGSCWVLIYLLFSWTI